MEAVLEKGLEIKRSKRLKGQPVLPGDALAGFQALLLAALAEGPTRLENLPISPWFKDILDDFVLMGYAQQALDGHWVIHGGNMPVSGPEPLRVRHEAELLPLAAFLFAKGCRRSLAVDPDTVSGEAMELLEKILRLENPPRLVPADARLQPVSQLASQDAAIAETTFSETAVIETALSNTSVTETADVAPNEAANPSAPDSADAGSGGEALSLPELDFTVSGETQPASAQGNVAVTLKDVYLFPPPVGLTARAAQMLRPPMAATPGTMSAGGPGLVPPSLSASGAPGMAQGGGARPADSRWDEYLAKLTLLSYGLASGQPVDISLTRPGPDSLEFLAAHFEAPLRVERNEAPEGDELARRIARQLRAAGKQEAQIRVRLETGAKLNPQTYAIPSDITLASAYCLAASLIKGSDITLEGVPLNPQRAGFIAALRRMGADIEVISRRERQGEGLGVLRVRSAELFGKRFGAENLTSMRDEVFLLMVAAAYAEGETVIRDVAYLRRHRVDLLKGFAANLKSAGVEIGEIEDGLVIRGRPDYDGGAYDACGNPGLGLACQIMGLKSHGASLVWGAECVAGRYPDFQEQMATLAAGDKP